MGPRGPSTVRTTVWFSCRRTFSSSRNALTPPRLDEPRTTPTSKKRMNVETYSPSRDALISTELVRRNGAGESGAANSNRLCQMAAMRPAVRLGSRKPCGSTTSTRSVHAHRRTRQAARNAIHFGICRLFFNVKNRRLPEDIVFLPFFFVSFEESFKLHIKIS